MSNETESERLTLTRLIFLLQILRHSIQPIQYSSNETFLIKYIVPILVGFLSNKRRDHQ